MAGTKKIVITGVGVVSPFGIGKKKFWSSLKKGESALKKISLFSTRGLPCKKAGEVKGFNASALIGSKGLQHLNRCAQFVLAASKLGLEDAGLLYPIPQEISSSYGVALGVSRGSLSCLEEVTRQAIIDGSRFVDPILFSNVGLNAIASQLSIRYNITGFNTTLATCAPSCLDSIYYAKNMIDNYGYKVVLCGAVEELSEFAFNADIRVKWLSGSRRSKDKEMCCPYDKRRNGVIVSEGACIFVVEELEHAKKRKAKVYAEVKNYGCSYDPDTNRGRSTKATGATKAIIQALGAAKDTDRYPDCIIGSANSTSGNDRTEAIAINNALGPRAKNVPVTSIISMIGDSKAAVGAFNIAAAVGALEQNFIPPTINYIHPDKKCALNIVANKHVRKKMNSILVNSFGTNGTNSSLLIGKAEV